MNISTLEVCKITLFIYLYMYIYLSIYLYIYISRACVIQALDVALSNPFSNILSHGQFKYFEICTEIIAPINYLNNSILLHSAQVMEIYYLHKKSRSVEGTNAVYS